MRRYQTVRPKSQKNLPKVTKTRQDTTKEIKTGHSFLFKSIRRTEIK